MKKRVVILLFACLALASRVMSDETDGKFVLTRELLLKAVTSAHNGDRKLLKDMEYMFQMKSKVVIPKDLLFIYTDLLKDQNLRVQRLGLSGIAYFKDPQSQTVLVAYIKAKNPRALEEHFKRSTETEREKNYSEYHENMYNAAYAVYVLGEIGDQTVIPFLESLRGIDDLLFGDMETVVDIVLDRLKARGPMNSDEDRTKTK